MKQLLQINEIYQAIDGPFELGISTSHHFNYQQERGRHMVKSKDGHY